MKKVRKVQPFNWSRTPSREGINKVFLADPYAYTTFGKHITKDELCKKVWFRNMFYFTLAMIPFIFFVYNIFIGVTR
jgi:hypothetical protein